MLQSRLLARPPLSSTVATGRRYLSSVRAVDVGGLLSGAPAARRRDAVEAIHFSLLSPRGGGYIIAENLPAFDDAYVEGIYRFSRIAHALPVDVKKQFAGQGGAAKEGVTYSGTDAGQPEPSYDPATVATACSLDYSRGGKSALGAHVFPPMPAADISFDGVLGELYDRQNVVAAALLEGVAEALGEPRDTFAKHFATGDMGTIRLISYPGSEDADAAADADIGIAPHTDFECFTLMHQTSPGLQFLPPAGAAGGGVGGGAGGATEWVDAPVGPFIAIIGDMLERFTNGTLKATPHRVVRMPAPRMSMIRFNAVAPETLVQPLGAFVSEARPAAYTPVTMRRHMETTLANLERGLGSWDPVRQVSTSATYRYD